MLAPKTLSPCSFDSNELFAKLQQSKPFFVLAGPCVVESKEHALKMGEAISAIRDKLGIEMVYKSSFDKANRTSITSYRGPGMEEALAILQEVKTRFRLPIVTDVHDAHQCEEVAKVADILQIPAFLCRQTDLLLAAGKTGRIVNIKKGQFAGAEVMHHAAKKIIEGTGNTKVLLCERGTTFGYNDLIVDARNLVRMRGPFGEAPSYMVVQDATHSVQQPGSQGNCSGGLRHFIPTISRMAAAVGVHGFFFETHDNPKEALSDGPNAWPLQHFEPLLRELMAIAEVSQGFKQNLYPYDS